jgi:hypothetical protein
METKYGSMRGGWCSNEVVGPFRVGLWKNIRRGWGIFLYLSNMRWVTGLRSSFGLCGDHPLKASFSELFSIACCEASVADHMQFFNSNIQWYISFTRPVHDWKVDLVISFFNILYSLKLRRGGEDKICWIPSRRRTFKVRSFFHALYTPTSSPFPWRQGWHSLCRQRC